jgi:hypothetical protein
VRACRTLVIWLLPRQFTRQRVAIQVTYTPASIHG